MQKTRILKGEEGQSSVEFILTFAFAIGVVYLFVYQSINMTTGYMAHYATYMTSRTFMSYDRGSNTEATNVNEAENVAKEVFSNYQLQRFDLKVDKLKFNKPSPVGSTSNLFSGVTFVFEKKLTPYNIVGGSKKATFHAESFLGKEPLRISCYNMTCKAMGKDTCAPEMLITLFDNGC